MDIFSLLWNSNDSDRYDLSVKEYKENKSEPWDISYWFAFPNNDYPYIKWYDSPTSIAEKNFPKNLRNSYEWYLERNDADDEANWKNTFFITSGTSHYTSYNDAHNWIDSGNLDIDLLEDNDKDMIDSLLSLIIPGSWLFLFDPLLFPEATRLYHYYYDFESYDGMDYLQRLDLLESKVELVFYKTNIEYNVFDFSMLFNAYKRWTYQTYNPIENSDGLIHSEFKEISKDEFIDSYNKDVKTYMEYLLNIDNTQKREQKYMNGAKGPFNNEWPDQYVFGLKARENAELWGHPLKGEILISSKELTKKKSLYKFSENIDFWYDNFDFRHLLGYDYTGFSVNYLRDFISWEDNAVHFHWLKFISFLIDNYNRMTYYTDPSIWVKFFFNKNIEFSLSDTIYEFHFDFPNKDLPWIDTDNQKWEWLGNEIDFPDDPPTYNWIEYFDHMFDYHNVYWLVDENGEISPETIKVEAKLNKNATPWFTDIDKDMNFGLTYDPNKDIITRVIPYDEVDNYQWSNRYKGFDVSNDLTVTPEEKVDKTKPNLWADGTMPKIILISLIVVTIIGTTVLIIFKIKRK